MARASRDGVRGNVEIPEGGLHRGGGLPPTREKILFVIHRSSARPPSFMANVDASGVALQMTLEISASFALPQKQNSTTSLMCQGNRLSRLPV